jgi:hypothetical protein
LHVLASQFSTTNVLWFINVNKLSSFASLAKTLMVSLPDAAAGAAVPGAADAADAPVASPIAKA